MSVSRRGFLTGLGAGLIVAPAVVSAANIMPVRNRLYEDWRHWTGWDYPNGDIARDFVLSPNGDIRYVGKGAKYTVLELHRHISEVMDDNCASCDGVLDITAEWPTVRHTDQMFTLQGPWNIDDHAAKYLKDGSITQSNGADHYTSGVEIKSLHPSLRRGKIT